MKDPKFRIKQSTHGKFFIQEKGWFFWNSLGRLLSPHPMSHRTTYYDTIDEADAKVKEWLSEEFILTHTEKVVKTYN